MKKVLFSILALGAISVSYSQKKAKIQEAEEAQLVSYDGYKPVKGTIATEVGLIGGLNNANFNLNTGVLKFRYFLKEDLALRLGLGLNSSKDELIDDTDPSDVETEIYKSSSTTFNLGIEKHFAGSNRLSTYAGADLLIQMNGASYSYSENGFSIDIEGNNNGGVPGQIASATASTGFGLRVLTGADYYIAKKVFLGVEAGLNFLTKKDKDIEINTRSGSVVTSTKISGNKNSGFETNVFGGIRIGYQF